ncbi:MAG: hypothetical protein Q6370_014290 [Candidatus Sigynarchaeota archaeon]|jgi:hypothetical protein
MCAFSKKGVGAIVPPPIDSAIDNILVQRLIKCYDPYHPLGIGKKQFAANGKRKPRAKFVPEDERDNKLAQDPSWHYGRIAHFVNQIRKGKRLDQIEVDMMWHGHKCTGIVVLDGHHRLCAADIVGIERIPASISGAVRIIEWLVGKHDNAPEFSKL